MSSIVLTLRNKRGLKAANARKLAAIAQRYDDCITLKNLAKGSRPSNCKTFDGVVLQNVRYGDPIELRASGATGLLALDALQDLIETDFEDATFERRSSEEVDIAPYLNKVAGIPEQLRLPI